MPPGTLRRVLVLFGLVLWLVPGSADAQRPFRIYDPLYREERASRQFYDRFAFTGEVSYRPAPGLGGDAGSIDPDPIGYAITFGYQLARNVDLGVVLDAAGGVGGRSLTARWVSLKVLRKVDLADYAFRLAVDPASDGNGGFPQLDVAFLYTTPLSPELSTHYSIGLRRVRIGFEQLSETSGGADLFDLIQTQALGWELHAAISYSAFFDPAGSNVFLGLLGEAGSYDLIERGPADEEGGFDLTEYRGGVVWLRTGLQFSRPSFEFQPFLGLPISQWAPKEGVWPGSRLRTGVRLMLR